MSSDFPTLHFQSFLALFDPLVRGARQLTGDEGSYLPK